MNLSILKSATPMLGRLALQARKFSPEILLGAGVIGFVATNVLSSRASLKLRRELEEMRDSLEEIQEKGEELLEIEPQSVYSKQDFHLDLTRVYVKHSFRVAKLYAPAVIVGGLSIAAFVASNQILHNRNVALMAAYQTVAGAYSRYQSAVVERLGIDEEKDLRYGITKVKVDEEVTDKDGKTFTKAVTKYQANKDPNKYSPYARFFDEYSTQWQRDPVYNLHFLKAQQSQFNMNLKTRGHVFLNEVYRALGFEDTSAGAVVGWVLSEDGDNFIDFGIYDINSPAGRAFVNGLEKSVLLDFNVDGVIFDKI